MTNEMIRMLLAISGEYPPDDVVIESVTINQTIEGYKIEFDSVWLACGRDSASVTHLEIYEHLLNRITTLENER